MWSMSEVKIDFKKVRIKTDIYHLIGVRAGDSGIIQRTSKNYFGQTTFEVRVSNETLIFTEDEIELVRERNDR